MIHLSTLHTLVEIGEFSIQFYAEDGHVVDGKRCICTSWHSSGKTMNIKFCDSAEIRKVRRCSITKFNGQEVAL